MRATKTASVTKKKSPLRLSEEESDLNDIYNNIHPVWERVNELTFDEKRGNWGTEAELALTTAETDLASAMEQIERLRQIRCGKRK